MFMHICAMSVGDRMRSWGKLAQDVCQFFIAAYLLPSSFLEVLANKVAKQKKLPAWEDLASALPSEERTTRKYEKAK